MKRLWDGAMCLYCMHENTLHLLCLWRPGNLDKVTDGLDLFQPFDSTGESSVPIWDNIALWTELVLAPLVPNVWNRKQGFPLSNNATGCSPYALSCGTPWEPLQLSVSDLHSPIYLRASFLYLNDLYH